MNKGGICIIILLLFLGGRAGAQQLSNQVLVPAAGIVLTGGVSLSHTIGEPSVILLSSGFNDLTQGFQQPLVKLQPVDQPLTTGVEAYPVPTSEYLYIKLYGDVARKFTIQLMSSSGQILYTTQLDFPENYYYIHEIPVGEYSPGFYVVRVRCSLGLMDRTFKITII